MTTKYDYSVHIDQSIIAAEDQKLAAITGRRLVAQKRHADAIDAHSAATAAHRAALQGEGGDPFDTAAELKAAAERVSTASEAATATEQVIANAHFNHEHACGKAYEPMHRVALSHLIEAATKADQARALMAEAQAMWTAAAAASQTCVMHRSGIFLHPALFAPHSELAPVEGHFHIPSASEVTPRVKHSGVN
nr:hypothetical protein [uncultured Rhodopila sp.]